jgi:hypothetical protein
MNDNEDKRYIEITRKSNNNYDNNNSSNVNNSLGLRAISRSDYRA